MHTTMANRAPMWSWMIGVLLWAWIIPFNQWFWDDWLTAPLTGWGEQVIRWEGGAKHYLNPVVYFLLVPIGPWSFQLLILLSSAITAVALSRIMRKAPGISPEIASWTGPFCLVLPVFHARFSAAVLEYSICLAAMLLAWSILLETSKSRRWLLSLPLLIYAIGVPSLALLVPVAWVHLTYHDRLPTGKTWQLRSALRYWPLGVTPLAYAAIFQYLLNSKSRYQISVGALLEFTRGLLVLLVCAGITFLFVRSRQGQIPRRWYWAVGLTLGAYIAFFPYFAVGYNPLADFLPWRMREGLTSSALSQLTLVLILLALAGAIAYIVAGRQLGSRSLFGAAPIILISALFGALMVVFGPMDWESRHWIIAWPFLSLLLALLVGEFKTRHQFPTFISVFVVLLMSTTMISSEYLVDIFKQDSITSQIEKELSESIRSASPSDDRIVIVLEDDKTVNSLNARKRSYRPYEWWGLLAQGLRVEPEQLLLLTTKDIELHQTESCTRSEFNAIAIQPSVRSTRIEALIDRRVRIELNPHLMTLCSLQSADGWPRGG
ncbi:MAG: hypothetical protein EBZ68_01760 [Actinobacteria bacterium]|nr:hypothetical protein [Actinomycetota bacterium]